MSMRQAYKLAALQGWAAGRNVAMEQSNPARIAEQCGAYADAMIREDEEAANNG